MNIVFLSSEAVPFAKTGGLGDVCGALPATLAAMGHRVCLIMPAFRSIRQSGLSIDKTEISFAIEMRDQIVGARLLSAELPARIGQAAAQVYFVDQPRYFDRPELYGDAQGDYPDNCERFAFFCRAALRAITLLGEPVDIVHCHDWQTALVPMYMRLGFESHPWMRHARSLLTIHNLAYQGRFWHWDMPLTGLEWMFFNYHWLEYYGEINFLKAAILHADMLSTVSPTYAKEIQTQLHGHGLNPLLRARSDRLRGIINGIDEAVWNPATDPHLRLGGDEELASDSAGDAPPTVPTGNYDVRSWRSGKAIQKQRLQHLFGLTEDDQVPLIGAVGRLADQKGWDLILDVLRWHLQEQRPTQWVILGTGEPRYHEALTALAEEFPGRFGLRLQFSNSLAHRIEAAADLFVMPSRYEPCGLNQLYSLRYGTVPIVMATGGLIDTVVDTDAATLADGSATGFRMSQYSAVELDRKIGEALEVRYHRKKTWQQIVVAGMSQDWSWRNSAQQYELLYEEAVALKPTKATSG